MARKSRYAQNEEPPADWVPTQAVDEPVLSSPYAEPQAHWVYKDGIPSKAPGRRPASYYYKTKKVGTAQEELFAEEARDLLPLPNRLRADAKRWRESGYRGASPVTRDLFAWWAREDAPRRLFFCQRESVETVIYLLELAIPGRLHASGFRSFEMRPPDLERLLRGDRPEFSDLKPDEYFFPGSWTSLPIPRSLLCEGSAARWPRARGRPSSWRCSSLGPSLTTSYSEQNIRQNSSYHCWSPAWW